MNSLCDITSQRQLQAICHDSFIARCEFHDRVDSTNDRAVAAAKQPRDLPLLVFARQQTSGRGRGQNRWWAPDGCLTFSILLAPDQFGIPKSRWPTLSLITAMSVGKSIRALAPRADVGWKWPNDVLIERQKIAGILLESRGIRPPSLVIGVGVNVNNTPRNIAATSGNEELGRTSTSLSVVTGGTESMSRVLAQLLRQLAAEISHVSKAPESLSQQWQVRDVLANESVTVLSDDGTLRSSGTARGIDDEGSLLLATDEGHQRVSSGVVMKSK